MQASMKSTQRFIFRFYGRRRCFIIVVSDMITSVHVFFFLGPIVPISCCGYATTPTVIVILLVILME
jgi:hypothetical protein